MKRGISNYRSLISKFVEKSQTASESSLQMLNNTNIRCGGHQSAPRPRHIAQVASVDRIPSTLPIHPSSDVRSAVEAACMSLGRTFNAAEQELVSRLEQNWYEKASDLLNMTDAEATALGLPLRLKCIIASLTSTEPTAANADIELNNSTGNIHIPTDAATLSGFVSDGDNSWEDLPIEERVCPDFDRFGFGNPMNTTAKLTQRTKNKPYALKKTEITPPLQQEFTKFHKFLTEPFFGAQADPIAPVTANKYADHLRYMLGWLNKVRGVPLEELSFTSMLPVSSRKGVEVVFDYVQWLRTERDISVRTEGIVLRSLMAAAKFLYHDTSKMQLSSGDKPYADLEVVKELRGMVNSVRKSSKVQSRTSDESLKWLDWPDYLRLVKELKKECALLNEDGTERDRKQVAYSVQKYLIFGILSCIPDRQRTLRELEVGRTLVNEESGRWCIRHKPEDYKTGRSYGERPALVLAARLYPELEAFIDTWRKELAPEHNYLFSQLNGKPYTAEQLYKMFWTTSYRITGKKMNPHLVRDSIVTYLRGGTATEKELEALALYMGHSLEMQRGVYDRRTQSQKVEPAVELLEALNIRATEGF